MQKKFKYLTAATLAIAASASMAEATAPEAVPLPTSLTLDGYCDAFTNITQVSRKTYAATYDATTVCGQFSATAGGPAGRNLPNTGFAKQGVVFTVEGSAFFGVTLSWTINVDNTFTITDTAGNVINRGTWTAGGGAVMPTVGTSPSYRR